MRWPETPAEVRGGFPRVTIDGVGLGDSLAEVSRHWGGLERDASSAYRPRGTRVPLVSFLEPRAEVGPLGRVDFVSGEALQIDGKTVLKKGDPIAIVEARLGRSTPGLDRRERWGTTAFRTWEYRLGGQRYTVLSYNPEVFTLPAGVDPATVPELSTVLGFTLSPPDLGHTHSFFW